MATLMLNTAHEHDMRPSAIKPTITSYGMRLVSTQDPDGFQLFFICPADSK